MTEPVDLLGALPKISLHDHLDGGLRPQTLLELARQAGRELPAPDAESLGRELSRAADSGSLEQYLSVFEHTVAVLQTDQALTRAAREAVEDLAVDGVIHAELRWAPEQHTAGGLSMDQAVQAVQRGLVQGMLSAREQGAEIRAGQILCAMRQGERSAEVARLTIERFDPEADGGVLGFDLAGPEQGFPPSAHREALDLLARALVPVTLHAGEADGPESMRQALVEGRALRLGHGVRVVEDIDLADAPDDDVTIELGAVARWIRDRQIVLEVCPRSNAQTGAVQGWRPPQNLVRVLGPGAAEHPVGFLHRAGFRVTISPDNRLVSGTTLTRELGRLVAVHGFSLDDLEALQLNAAQAAFAPLQQRSMLEMRVAQAFEAARESGVPLGLGDLIARQDDDGARA